MNYSVSISENSSSQVERRFKLYIWNTGENCLSSDLTRRFTERAYLVLTANTRNNGLGKYGMKHSWCNGKCSRHFPRGTEENYGKLQPGESSVRDMNWVIPQYTSWALEGMIHCSALLSSALLYSALLVYNETELSESVIFKLMSKSVLFLSEEKHEVRRWRTLNNNNDNNFTQEKYCIRCFTNIIKKRSVRSVHVY